MKFKNNFSSTLLSTLSKMGLYWVLFIHIYAATFLLSLSGLCNAKPFLAWASENCLGPSRYRDIQQLRGQNFIQFRPPTPLEWTNMEILICPLSGDPPWNFYWFPTHTLLVHVVIDWPLARRTNTCADELLVLKSFNQHQLEHYYTTGPAERWL